MALPEMLSFEDLQDILAVSAPTGVSATTGFAPAPTGLTSAPTGFAAPPPMPLGDVGGSTITYIERPENITYSPENLPEFMKDFEQISPTLFAPSQGVFGQAPELDTVQPLMPQQYVDEYADLERAFQESIALDPTMFGGAYRSGIYMPTQVFGDDVPLDEPFDFAGAAAAAQILGNIFPRIEKPEIDMPKIDLGEPDISVPSFEVPLVDVSLPEVDVSLPKADINLEQLEESIQQGLLDPAEDIAKIPVQAIEDIVSSIDLEVPKPEEGFFDKIIPDIPLPSLPDISLPELPDVVEQGGKAVGDIVNLIDDPSVKAAEEAIEQINIAGQEGGVEGDVITEPVGKFITTTAAGASISDAINDPTASNLAQAYEAIDYITNEFAGVDPLKGSELAGEFGSVLSGIEALEDGIDSPAEAISVSKAAEAIGALTGSSATFDVASSISNFLAPIAAINTVDQAIQFAIKSWEGGAAGEYPNSYGTVSFNGSSFSSGNYGGGDGADSVWGESASKAATYGLNSLINRYGFEVDSAKAQEVLNSGVGNIASSSYYNTKGNRSNGPQKVMYELIKTGALKPTENTPESVLKSTDAFNKFLTSRFNSMQNYQAANQLDATGGTVTPRTPPTPFATQSAAENYVKNFGQQITPTNFDRGKFGVSIDSFELGDKTDGGQFLNKVSIEVVEGSKTGNKRVFDELGKDVSPSKRVSVPTHYIYRGQGAPTLNDAGIWIPSGKTVFQYDPKYDISPQAYEMYKEYTSEGRYSVPSIMGKASGNSALAKDAKLYMDKNTWERTFDGGSFEAGNPFAATAK
jgi:hypothetical protein